MRRDFLVDLVTGQLAAFAGLGALGHLDLQLVGVDQVFAGDAEAAAGHLLDGAAATSRRSDRRLKRTGSSPPSPVLLLPPMRFMAMASVSCASARDRAIRHRSGRKPLDDLLRRLDFVERHRRLGRFEFQQAAQREQLPLLIVDHAAELAKLLAAVQARGMLQLGDDLRAENVRLALAAPLILSADVERQRLRDCASADRRARGGESILRRWRRCPRLRCGWRCA